MSEPSSNSLGNRADAVEKEPSTFSSMPELSPRDQAVARLRLLWESRRLLMRVVIVGMALFAAAAFVLPAQYQSTTRLMPPEQSDASSALLMAASSASGSTGLGALAGDLLNLKSSGALLIGILESRTVQEALVEKLGLREVYGATRLTEAREALANRTNILEDRRAGIITIEIIDRNPRRAAAIAQGYVDELNDVVTQLNTTSAHRERVFLEQRLTQVKQDLESAEREFSEFASQNAAIDIQAQGKAVIDAAAMLEGESIAAQSELQSLKQLYSDGNVRVRAAQARVNELNRQLQKMDGGAEAAQPGAAAAPTAQGAILRDAAMVPSIRKLPLLGVSYADLYRRTKIEEALFQALTQEYKFAKVEEAKETPSVKVIDPPDVPEKKFSPHRLWIIAAGGACSFAGGLVWIFGCARWRMLDATDPARVLGLEVLAAARAKVRRIAADQSRTAAVRAWGSMRRRVSAALAKREHSSEGATSD